MIGRVASLAGVLLTAGAGSATAEGDPPFYGHWARGDGNARIRIAPCGSEVCVTNTWIKPGTPGEKTGDRLIMQGNSDGVGKWSGTAFDPQRNLRYKMTINVANDQMTSDGCLLGGLVCKHMSWTRLGWAR
jgi:uncharacterized protein (DUF2147 family)